MTYTDKLHATLTPAEHKVFKKLSTPNKIQDFLDKLPHNFSYAQAQTCRSPRRLLKDKRAYCFEGAVFAAAALAYHGRAPLLLDLQTLEGSGDEDHVLALFQEDGLWGAISKTNYPTLRWRDPVYKSVRELTMSFFHEYFLPHSGKKTLVAYSRPFNLARFAPERWVTAAESLDWLAEELDDSPHYPIASKEILKKARRAGTFERKATDVYEWKHTTSD